MPTITAIRPLRRREDRVAVHLDGAYWTSAPASAVLELGLATGQEITPERVEELSLVFERGRAVHYAVDLLSRRDYAVAEVERRLVAKPFPAAAVAAAIERLTSLGYLDDERFARSRAGAAARAGLSRARVADRLRRAGVPAALVREAVDTCYDRSAELGAARVAGARLDPASVTLREGRAKGYRFLASRGFPNDVAAAVLAEVAARSPAAVPAEAASAAPVEHDADELVRLIRRRYPDVADDAGARRRAWAFLARRLVPSRLIGEILAAATGG